MCARSSAVVRRLCETREAKLWSRASSLRCDSLYMVEPFAGARRRNHGAPVGQNQDRFETFLQACSSAMRTAAIFAGLNVTTVMPPLPHAPAAGLNASGAA